MTKNVKVDLKRYLKGSLVWINHIKEDDLDLLCGVIEQWQLMKKQHQEREALDYEELIKFYKQINGGKEPSVGFVNFIRAICSKFGQPE